MFPLPFRSTPYSRYAPTRGPSFFGLMLLGCGLLAIGSAFAPQAVDQAFPGLRSQIGWLLPLAVGLGLFRSIYRLIIPTLTLAFWITALLCVVKPHLSIPSFPQVASLGTTQEAPASIVPVSVSAPRHGTPALPDAAYFPPARGSGLQGLGLPTALTRMFNVRL